MCLLVYWFMDMLNDSECMHIILVREKNTYILPNECRITQLYRNINDPVNVWLCMCHIIRHITYL